MGPIRSEGTDVDKSSYFTRKDRLLSPRKKEFNLRATCPCTKRHPGSLQPNKALTQLALQVCSTWHGIWGHLAGITPSKKREKDQKERTNILMQPITLPRGLIHLGVLSLGGRRREFQGHARACRLKSFNQAKPGTTWVVVLPHERPQMVLRCGWMTRPHTPFVCVPVM